MVEGVGDEEGSVGVEVVPLPDVGVVDVEVGAVVAGGEGGGGGGAVGAVAFDDTVMGLLLAASVQPSFKK